MSPQNNPPHFRWLFFAVFKDGSFTKQTPGDALPNSNQFKEVLERQDKLAYFELHHVDNVQVVTVDLTTGNFVVNGTPVCIHNQGFDPSRYKLELVYFREKLESLTYKVSDNSTVSKVSQVSRYFLGWKTQVNGKSKQVTMAVG